MRGRSAGTGSNHFLQAVISPTLELWDITRKHTGHELRKTKFHQLLLNSCFHHFRGKIGLGELTIVVAVAAVFLAFTAIFLGPAALFVTSKRHAAALAILISLYP
ncbi:hypothetical protein PWYN_08385 [Paenibacillus wynnii]|uniref:Uncharacterized protein n=1 Tax=Paenibacillus wynnii TaxID=268407 RepID=A0A098MBC7_9BACL|nr:hypothetical protein PWYN_08385 [Paenibacillus wynnii]